MNEKELRLRILSKLKDLTDKIQNNESLPEGEQDINLLIEIDERIEGCLNCWYY